MAQCSLCSNIQTRAGSCDSCGEYQFKACLFCEAAIENHLEYHHECAKCPYNCGNPINEQVVESSRRADRPLGSHSHCHERHMRDEIARTPVTITQAMLNWYNDVRMLTMPEMELSVEGNQESVKRQFEKFVNKGIYIPDILGGQQIGTDYSNLEFMYKFVARVEMLAACGRILISKDKHKAKAEIAERDIAKFKKVAAERKAIAESTPRERRKLSLRDKAVAGLIAIGFSESEAIAEAERRQKGSIQ